MAVATSAPSTVSNIRSSLIVSAIEAPLPPGGGSHGSQFGSQCLPTPSDPPGLPAGEIAGEELPVRFIADQGKDQITGIASHRRGHWFEPSIAHPRFPARTPPRRGLRRLEG